MFINYLCSSFKVKSRLKSSALSQIIALAILVKEHFLIFGNAAEGEGHPY